MFFQYTTLEGYCCANLGEMFGFRNGWGGFLAGEWMKRGESFRGLRECSYLWASNVSMKYPIGMQSFDQIVEEGFVYVDKTDLVYSLATEGKIYFLCRPRRFGKSLLVSTLKNYFLGRKELFRGLAMERLEREWAEYPVFHIDFNGSDFTRDGSLEAILEGIVTTWENAYGRSEVFSDIGRRFAEVLRRAHERTGRRCVVLVDEYDKPILDVLDSGGETEVDGERLSLEERNRRVLRGFYSVFKLADEDLRFVLLTGVTKFSQVSVFSGFNQPKDISMDGRYDTICGITREEMERYFGGAIDGMAEAYRCDGEEMRRRLKRRYDGYHFSTRLVDVYNPFSLLNAFDSQQIADYWFSSGTPSYLVRLLAHSRENMNELTGRYYARKQFVDYKADVEQPLPMIYQSGYLTIKDYEMDDDTFLLDFPNDEVKEGFLTMVAANYLKTREDVSTLAMQLNRALKGGDTERFRELLTAFLASIPYEMRRKEDEGEKERYFQYTFYLILRLLGVYAARAEERQSRGRVDCVVETPGYVYVFEFKLDGSAGEALRQIEERGYARPYGTDGRQVVRVGASFSSETGTVEDWAVETGV